MIFADPPYNLQLRGELWRPNQTRVDGVDDEWDQFEDFAAYDQFTEEWLRACRRVLRDNGTIWVIGTYHNIYRIGTIMQDLGFWFLNDFVWIKTNPMPQFRGVRFANAHETLLWCKKSRNQKKYTFNYEALKAMNDDKQMRSDWVLPICSGTERIHVNGEKAHPTQKPEALLWRVIIASSNFGDVVLDPFFGVGTTGAVARKLGRHYIGIEREDQYIRAATERIDAIIPPLVDPGIYGTYVTKRSAPRLPFSALLENGLLSPGQKVYFNHRLDQWALVVADGTLRLQDGTRASIHRAGAIMGNLPACNGWDHWYYQDERGEMIVIDVLREQLRRKLFAT